MIRYLTQLTAAITLIAASATLAPEASAGHDSPIYCAADRYRDAVCDFERHVYRARYVSKCDERLVDQLEDSTSRLRSAARDCDRPDRLFARFAETDSLHRQVEARLFGHGHYPHDPKLWHCWGQVTHAYREVVCQIRTLQRGHHPIHGYHTTQRPPAPVYTAKPPRYNPDPFYRSDYGPTFRSETFGPRPALSGPTGRSIQGRTSPSIGAQLQRRYPTAPPTRYPSSREEIGAALIGALLQRALN